jgi:hypothetical protein
MPSAGRELFTFEGYTLDLTRGCLLGPGGEIELRPNSFELLRYLVENAGRLVPKDELVNHMAGFDCRPRNWRHQRRCGARGLDSSTAGTLGDALMASIPCGRRRPHKLRCPVRRCRYTRRRLSSRTLNTPPFVSTLDPKHQQATNALARVASRK